MPEIQEIQKFIDLIKNTDIEQLSWETKDFKISLKKSEIPLSTNIEQKDITENNENKKELQKKQEPSKTTTIKSPMVGRFYRAESNDHPPFVVEGSKINVGQKLAVIEAMKIMKDVISNVKGTITKILVENEQPVEYGQELFLVEIE